MSLKSAAYGVGMRIEAPRDGLVVKPDVARLPITLQVEGLEPERALQALREAAELLGRMAAETGRATLQLGSFSSGRREDAKSAASGRALLQGTVEAPLGAELDFWERAAIDARLSGLGQRLLQELKRARSTVEASCGNVSFAVADPERYRPELIRRFVARAREFTELASSSTAPLALIEVQGLGPVELAASTPTEATLTLSLSARFGAP